jgi:hypothetical protein
MTCDDKLRCNMIVAKEIYSRELRLMIQANRQPLEPAATRGHARNINIRPARWIVHRRPDRRESTRAALSRAYSEDLPAMSRNR